MKRHLVALVAAAVFFFMPTARAQYCGDNSDLAPDAATSTETHDSPGAGTIDAPAADRPLRRGKPAVRTNQPAAPGESSGSSWARTAVSLAGVVALIGFLAWGYRAVAGGGLRGVRRGRRPGLIEVLSRTALSPRQSLCLVRVGPRAVLIGATGDSLRTLDVIDDAAVVAQLAGQVQRGADAPAREFERHLEREQHEFDRAESANAAEDPADVAIRALALKQKLIGAAR